MKPRWEPFCIEHLESFPTKIFGYHSQVSLMMREFHDQENAYTFFWDETPIAFGGIDLMKKSNYGRWMGELWIILTDKFQSSYIESKNDLVYHLAWKFRAMKRKYDFYRLHAEVRGGDGKTPALLEKLGFRQEAVIPCCTEEEGDLLIYGWVSDRNRVPLQNQEAVTAA